MVRRPAINQALCGRSTRIYLRQPTTSRSIAKVTSQRPHTMRMDISIFKMRKRSFRAKSLTQGHTPRWDLKRGACQLASPKQRAKMVTVVHFHMLPVWTQSLTNRTTRLLTASQVSGLMLDSGRGTGPRPNPSKVQMGRMDLREGRGLTQNSRVGLSDADSV